MTAPDAVHGPSQPGSTSAVRVTTREHRGARNVAPADNVSSGQRSAATRAPRTSTSRRPAGRAARRRSAGNSAVGGALRHHPHVDDLDGRDALGVSIAHTVRREKDFLQRFGLGSIAATAIS